jgi:hypothetical protein
MLHDHVLTACYAAKIEDHPHDHVRAVIRQPEKEHGART